jgi:replicative DNA helicase
MTMHTPSPMEDGALEMEQNVLGCILFKPDTYDIAAAYGLEPHHFGEPVHASIYDACTRQVESGKPISFIAIKMLLPDAKIGDLGIAEYIARLISNTLGSGFVPEHIAGIKAAAARRDLVSLAQMAQEAAGRRATDLELSDEIEALRDRFETTVSLLQGRDMAAPAGAAYLASFSSASARAEDQPGVPIYFKALQKVISEPSFEEGNLYGFLSSSGEGKTSFVLQIMLHALKQGHPVLFLSYDQSPAQIVRQWIAQEYGIEARRQKRPADMLKDNEQSQCVEFARWIDKQPIEIIKCHREPVKQLLTYARRFRKKHKANTKTALIVLDHIGKVDTPGKAAMLSADKIAGAINVELKAAADPLRAAILVLQQRGTAGTKRDNPRPIASDLYGGEGARADYDAVAYLYRAEKYKAEREKTAASDADWKKINRVFPPGIEGKAEIGALKVRFGDPNITEDLEFEARFTRYRPVQDTAGNSYQEQRML